MSEVPASSSEGEGALASGLSSRIVLTLYCTRGGLFPYSTGQLAHGWFFRLLASRCPDLANRLHEPHDGHPFVVSPLLHADEPHRWVKQSFKGRLYELHLSSTLGELTEVLHLGLVSEHEIILGSCRFEVRAMAVSPTQHPRAMTLRGQDLYHFWKARSAFPARVEFRFETPTTFHSGGRSLPLPDPCRIFTSLARSWERAQLPRVAETTQALVMESVLLARHRLETRSVRFRNYCMIGFVGRCEFELEARDPEVLRTVCFLSAFAPFSGVGYHTAMGMGQTWTIPIGLSGAGEVQQ